MNKRQSDVEVGENPIQSKVIDVNANKNDVADSQAQESAIFKLNAICCDDLFEWLPLEDLHSLGQTCKRMHRLTGLYFQENYKGIFIYRGGDIHYNGFIQFVRSIQFHFCAKISDVQYIATNCDSLREVGFFGKIDKSKIDCLKVKLDRIENIQLIFTPYMNGSLDIYYDILRFCTNLKSLSIDIMWERDNNNEWMYHKYPKLQQLTIREYGTLNDDAFKIFLKLNTQLQILVIFEETLLRNNEHIINSKVQLDILHTSFDSKSNWVDNCKIVNNLHANGVYKRLSFIVQNEDVCQDRLNQIGKLRGLQFLSTCRDLKRNLRFPTIETIRNLTIIGSLQLKYMENMVDSFPNLREVTITSYEMKIENLIPFIRRLPQLKAIGIPHFEQNLDLLVLNEERKKLSGACKLTIYVPEHIYFRTMETYFYANCNLIEIKRLNLSNMMDSDRYRLTESAWSFVTL